MIWCAFFFVSSGFVLWIFTPTQTKLLYFIFVPAYIIITVRPNFTFNYDHDCNDLGNLYFVKIRVATIENSTILPRLQCCSVQVRAVQSCIADRSHRSSVIGHRSSVIGHRSCVRCPARYTRHLHHIYMQSSQKKTTV